MHRSYFECGQAEYVIVQFFEFEFLRVDYQNDNNSRGRLKRFRIVFFLDQLKIWMRFLHALRHSLMHWFYLSGPPFFLFIKSFFIYLHVFDITHHSILFSPVSLHHDVRQGGTLPHQVLCGTDTNGVPADISNRFLVDISKSR